MPYLFNQDQCGTDNEEIIGVGKKPMPVVAT
jgi:hypothetical protein